ncbi:MULTISPECIES: MBL fold metallo-hydrolase [unclassified Fusibacter]|uniref:MBL fold metallo-hydrolase n=1 Tax=unclassified Fusibacter TaxID=2624464 RepID=UPI001010B981|nr:MULTISPECIES: MBL fold metallo-hydrolase [unclassified Fusibacter]MCK8060305.1 MBL fold metallo-hydrolase [Fusibacter sp. A2]NPE20406.1 MBL fold metallo-hydrolase [Fusibacter sp. A1]RXV63611.1 MBL fold metallo-hydrolase [Fusibacter sp. A1]
MLTFIGIGSAFNTPLGNTSAFIKSNDELLLIDCGSTVFKSINESGLLEDVRKISVIITHTHPDHAGSLGDLIFYAYYIMKTQVDIYFPDRQLMEKFLSAIGCEPFHYKLSSRMYESIEHGEFKGLSVEFIDVSHVDVISTFGFLLRYDRHSFYYSGDANNLKAHIIPMLANHEIDYAYQDVCSQDFDGNVHMSLRLLKETVPEYLRSKVFCMHFDKYLNAAMVEAEGFSAVSIGL